MNGVELYQWTLFLALIFVVIEMLTGSFLFLGFAVGALPLVFIHYSTEEVKWGSDLAVFSVTSAISFVLLRKFFKNRRDTSSIREDVNEY